MVVTDKDGDSSQAANLTISIVDDAPVAHADTDAVAAGQVTESGNVITAAGTTSGAAGTDVRHQAGVVAGVAAGNTEQLWSVPARSVRQLRVRSARLTLFECGWLLRLSVVRARAAATTCSPTR